MGDHSLYDILFLWHEREKKYESLENQVYKVDKVNDIFYNPEWSTDYKLHNIYCWTFQITQALRYLHDRVKPIIHRDLNPKNIIMFNFGRMLKDDFVWN